MTLIRRLNANVTQAATLPLFIFISIRTSSLSDTDRRIYGGGGQGSYLKMLFDKKHFLVFVHASVFAGLTKGCGRKMKKKKGFFFFKRFQFEKKKVKILR